jgi:hypothetical protein
VWKAVQLPEATWKQTLCQSSKEIPLGTYDGILCVVLLEAGGRGGLFDCLKQHVNKHFAKSLWKSPWGLMMESSVSCFLKLRGGRGSVRLPEATWKQTLCQSTKVIPWGLMMESSVFVVIKQGYFRRFKFLVNIL